MMRAMRLVLLFVDGVGLGEDDPATNPLVRAQTPSLRRVLGGRPLAGRALVETSEASLVPLDAQLGIPGLPQSATGQTALLTGENAPALVGRHVTAYPTPSLQKLLQARGLFPLLRRAGLPVALANAYTPEYFAPPQGRRRRHGAFTLNALQAGVRLRDVDDLRAGQAVYHDLTNAQARLRGAAVPLVTPEDAGRHLAAVAAQHALTVFEFFLTDLVGHRRIPEDSTEVVERFDRFLGAVLDEVDLEDTVVCVTSDHGNLEDERTDGHTANPVPALLVGAARHRIGARLQALTDVAPAYREALGAGGLP
jgi:hypothetical protein